MTKKPSRTTPAEEINLDGVDTAAQPEDNQTEDNQPEESNSFFDDAHGEDLLDRVIAAKEQLIKWEKCELPSRGLYYGWDGGVIEVRPMTQSAEKYMANSRLARSGQSVDYMFRECIRFVDGFDPSQLLIGDRAFLLFYIRGITYGNEYEFSMTCRDPECGATSTHMYDLNELAGTIQYGDEGIGPEPFKVVLPYLSEVTGQEFWIKIRFLRSYDATDIIARRRSKRVSSGRAKSRKNDNQQMADVMIDDNIEKIIVNAMGSEDVFKIRQLARNLHAKDTSTIREWLKEHTPGIDTSVDVICPHCGSDFNIALPISDAFFRSSAAGASG